MIWRWPICFSLLAFSFLAGELCAADVSGRVELADSHVAAVRAKRDYSGVVVSLRAAPWKSPLEAQPQHATILQKDKTFSPHVLAVTVGSSVSFPNMDPIFHNAFSNYNGEIFDVGLYQPGTTRTVRFNGEGVVRVFCNIHSMMSAVIVVLATPYFAVTKRDGSFSIQGVPAGEYDLTIFHERATESVLRSLARRIRVGPEPQMIPLLKISEADFIAIPHKNKYGSEYSPEPRDVITYPSRK